MKLISPGQVLKRLKSQIKTLSINRACAEMNLLDLRKKLRTIVPDLSDQYTASFEDFNAYYETNIRTVHSFQCDLIIKVLKGMLERQTSDTRRTIVDIGDSSGTHMTYIKNLMREEFDINSISVNLDRSAVEKMIKKGHNAILCRAEDLDIEEDVDLFVSFEMLEHLHNPSGFLHRLAVKGKCNDLVITVPYVKNSRMGLGHIRHQDKSIASAESEHIFELSPEDWSLLFYHSGWRVVDSQIYYQYPRHFPILSKILEYQWRKSDFEGFWGAVLERDTTYADLYLDWE